MKIPGNGTERNLPHDVSLRESTTAIRQSRFVLPAESRQLSNRRAQPQLSTVHVRYIYLAIIRQQFVSHSLQVSK